MEEEKNYLDELAYKIANDNMDYYECVDDEDEDGYEVNSLNECYSSAIDMAKEIFNIYENDPDKFHKMRKESEEL